MVFLMEFISYDTKVHSASQNISEGIIVALVKLQKIYILIEIGNCLSFVLLFCAFVNLEFLAFNKASVLDLSAFRSKQFIYFQAGLSALVQHKLCAKFAAVKLFTVLGRARCICPLASRFILNGYNRFVYSTISNDLLNRICFFVTSTVRNLNNSIEVVALAYGCRPRESHVNIVVNGISRKRNINSAV